MTENCLLCTTTLSLLVTSTRFSFILERSVCLAMHSELRFSPFTFVWLAMHSELRFSRLKRGTSSFSKCYNVTL